MNKPTDFLFRLGTGDLWLCFDDNGFGFDIELCSDGLTWQWSAQKEYWHGLGSGQSSSRELAISTAVNCLLLHGYSLSTLPRIKD